jgi:hypothetical protein
MTRVCTICESPQRREIDRALVRGQSMRGLATRYGTGRESMRRHRTGCLPALLALAYEAEQVAEANRLLSRVQAMTERMEDWLDCAERSHNYAEVRRFAGEWRHQIELLAKLAGQLEQEGTVNITISAEWIELKAVLVEALRPHPEALGDVLSAIRRRDLTNGHE